MDPISRAEIDPTGPRKLSVGHSARVVDTAAARPLATRFHRGDPDGPEGDLHADAATQC
jgi:hypothetical protein